MKKLLFIVGVLVIVSGCSPQRRLERLLKYNPQLAEAKMDSILIPGETVFDTAIEMHYDTLHIVSSIDKVLWQIQDSNCIKLLAKQKVALSLANLVLEKKCLERPLIFHETISYFSDSSEIHIPVEIAVSQSANAFNISVLTTDGKVLFKYKRFPVRQITTAEIWQYRKEGMTILFVSLLVLFIIYLVLKVYLNFTPLKFLKL